MARNIQSDEKQGPTTLITVSSKAVIQNGRADKVLPRQGKAKGSSSPSHYYIKCQRDLFKKKKIKTMNNKIAINTYQSTIESKNQTKQTRRTETESWTWKAF